MLTAIQKAIYQELSALGYPVYDEVPDNAQMPYITIGEETADDWSTKTGQGIRSRFNVHVWSDYKGMKELKTIVDQVINALNYKTFTADNTTLVLVRLDTLNIVKDPEENVRHAILRFEILSTEV